MAMETKLYERKLRWRCPHRPERGVDNPSEAEYLGAAVAAQARLNERNRIMKPLEALRRKYARLGDDVVGDELAKAQAERGRMLDLGLAKQIHNDIALHKPNVSRLDGRKSKVV